MSAQVIAVDGVWRVVIGGRALPYRYTTEEAAEAEAIEQDAERATAARQAGMAFGVQGYNDALGYDTQPPEPCGHHCDSDCPRCGDDW
jgi:hypothetical protein